MVGIYKITNPTNKIYIGQSVDIKHRTKQYKNLNVKSQPAIYNSIKKYGWEKHKFEIIEQCTLELLNEREVYWGNYYNVLSSNGLNCRLGNAGGKMNEKAKKNISKALTGRKTPWNKERMSKVGKSNKGKARSTDFKNNVRKNNSKPILQYSMDMELIKEWECGFDAARYLGKGNAAISECTNGKAGRKSAYGYIWKFKE